MKNNLGKILRSDYSFQDAGNSGYQLQLLKIAAVWKGSNKDDYGILRLFRLTLVSILLLFPGVFIDQLVKSKSSIGRKLIVEFYVLLKTVFPMMVLIMHWYSYSFLYYLSIYLLIETYIYLFSKIFLSDQHGKSSNMRTLLLLTFNFFESGLTFAVIYIAGNYLNIDLRSTVDAIYFSFVTSATIGYGDVYPINHTGKIITVVQILCSVSFIVLFFNFFSGKANQAEVE
ncbi:MAG: potassium channel family protein [Pelobium sp.]